METKEEILDLKIKIEDQICGVYFLIHNDTIVYIGSSVDIHRRLIDHKRNKEFDSFTILPCAEEGVREVEKEYILKFLPKYNKYIPRRIYVQAIPCKNKDLIVKRYIHWLPNDKNSDPFNMPYRIFTINEDGENVYEDR